MTLQDHTIDLSLMSAVLDRYSGRHRDALLPMLHEAQAIYGWLPRPVLEEIGRILRVPLAEIHGVVEFYTMFYNEPTARRVVRVCEDSACFLAGADSVIEALEARLALASGQTSSDGSVTYERVPCLGMCEQAPAALNGERPAGHLQPDDADRFLAGDFPEPKALVYGEPLLMLARVGKVDPTSLADYQSHGGYQALRSALAHSAEEIVARVDSLEIYGRGGAMFPVGRKWRMTRDAPGDPAAKHVVVNADESEPGTFKDRCLMEEDPFSLVEATTLAGYAVGAANGWFFVRGEYPRSYARLSEAVRQARAAGFLGRNIMGREGFHFDIELRLGAGAYICGEETALFEAIEGRRGFPRIKPPFPVTHGLFQQPTAINNVETLAAVLAGLNVGVDEWRRLGAPGSPGTKWFCLSGHVALPGLYELPFGLTIGQLIDMAGGVTGGGTPQAILMGGAAGIFVGPERMDVPLTYQHSRAEGIPLGSGVVMVFNDQVDLRPILYQLARFFAHESCGKCFPCQLGTHRQKELLANVVAGRANGATRATLLDVGFTMSQTSLCGLGQTAASAVVSALSRWPELIKK